MVLLSEVERDYVSTKVDIEFKKYHDILAEALNALTHISDYDWYWLKLVGRMHAFGLMPDFSDVLRNNLENVGCDKYNIEMFVQYANRAFCSLETLLVTVANKIEDATERNAIMKSFIGNFMDASGSG